MIKNKKRFGIKLIIFAAAMLLMMNACGRKNADADNTSASTALDEDKYKIYMVDSFIGYFYCNNVYRGAVEAADELGDVELKRVGPYQINIEKQLNEFDRAIEEGADAIFLTALTPDEWTEPINKAIENGIPVVCYDCDAADSERLAYYGTMNYKAGYMAGIAMTEQLGGFGNVAVMVGAKDAQNNIERLTGFEDALKNESDINIICIESTDNLLNEAIAKARKIFKEYQDIDGIFASSGSDAQAAVQIMKEKDIEAGKIKIIGFDDDKKTLELIKNGSVAGTIVQNTNAMGYESVMHLYKVLKGELPMEKAENGSDSIDTGIIFVTNDNVDTYSSEWKYDI